MIKGLTPEIKMIKSIIKLYEFDIEILQNWQIRFIYFGKEVFDYYPRKRRLFDLSNKSYKNAWHTLPENWISAIHEILKVYIIADELIINSSVLYPNKKVIK